jgi:hypothetical protein
MVCRVSTKRISKKLDDLKRELEKLLYSRISGQAKKNKCKINKLRCRIKNLKRRVRRLNGCLTILNKEMLQKLRSIDYSQVLNDCVDYVSFKCCVKTYIEPFLEDLGNASSSEHIYTTECKYYYEEMIRFLQNRSHEDFLHSFRVDQLFAALKKFSPNKLTRIYDERTISRVFPYHNVKRTMLCFTSKKHQLYFFLDSDPCPRQTHLKEFENPKKEIVFKRLISSIYEADKELNVLSNLNEMEVVEKQYSAHEKACKILSSLNAKQGKCSFYRAPIKIITQFINLYC